MRKSYSYSLFCYKIKTFFSIMQVFRQKMFEKGNKKMKILSCLLREQCTVELWRKIVDTLPLWPVLDEWSV